MEGELPGEVVHAAGVHQAQSVSHRLGAQNTLSCDWTKAAIGQSRRHDAGALAGDFDGAQLTERNINTDSERCFEADRIQTDISL